MVAAMSDLVRLLRESNPNVKWCGEGGLFQRAADEIAKLRNALMDVSELLDGYVDIVDGPEGKPLANKAMQAQQLIAEALGDE